MSVTDLSITNSGFNSILFSTTKTMNKESSLDIRCDEIPMKQYHKVTYLGYTLDEDLLGESTTLTSELKFSPVFLKKISPFVCLAFKNENKRTLNL